MERHNSREKSRNEQRRESGRAEKKKEKYKDLSPEIYYDRSSSKKKHLEEKSYSRDKYAAEQNAKYQGDKYQGYERSQKYEQDYSPNLDSKSKGSKRKQMTPQSRDSRSPIIQSKHENKKSRYHSPSPKPTKIKDIERGRSREKKQKKQKGNVDNYEQNYQPKKQYHDKEEMKQKKYHNSKEHHSTKQFKDYAAEPPRKSYQDDKYQTQYDNQDRKYHKSKDNYQDKIEPNKKQFKDDKYMESQQKYYKEAKEPQKQYKVDQYSMQKKYKDEKFESQKYYKDDKEYEKKRYKNEQLMQQEKHFKDDKYVQQKYKEEQYHQPGKKSYKEERDFKKRDQYYDDVVEQPQKNYKTKDPYSNQQYEKSNRQKEYFKEDPLPKKNFDKHNKVYDDQKYYKDKQYYQEGKSSGQQKKYYDDQNKYDSSKKQSKVYQEKYEEPSYSKSKAYDGGQNSSSKKSQYYSPQRDSYSGNESLQIIHSHKSTHKKEKAVYSDDYSEKDERMTKKTKKNEAEKSKKKTKVMEVDEPTLHSNKTSSKNVETKKKHKEVLSYSSDDYTDNYETKQKPSKNQKYTSEGESENERKKLKPKKKKKQKQDEEVILTPPKKKNKEFIEEDVKDKKKVKKRKRAREFSSQSFSDNEVPVKVKKTKHIEKNEDEWKTVDAVIDSPPPKQVKKKKTKENSPSHHRYSDNYQDSQRDTSYDEKSSRSDSQNRHYDAPISKHHQKIANPDSHPSKYQDQRLREDSREERGPRSFPKSTSRSTQEVARQQLPYKEQKHSFEDKAREPQYCGKPRAHPGHKNDIQGSDRSYETKDPYYQSKNPELNRYDNKLPISGYKNINRDQRKPDYEDQRYSDNNRSVNSSQMQRELPRNKDYKKFQQGQDFSSERQQRPINDLRNQEWPQDKRQTNRYDQKEAPRQNLRPDWRQNTSKNQQQHATYSKGEYSKDNRMTSWKGSELRVKTQEGNQQHGNKWTSPPGVKSQHSKFPPGNSKNISRERNRFSDDRSSSSSFPTYREVRNRTGEHRNIDLGLEVTIRDDGKRGKVVHRENKSRSPARLVSSYRTNQKPIKPYQENSDSNSKKQQDYKTPSSRYQNRPQNAVPLGRSRSNDRHQRKFDAKSRDIRERLDLKTSNQERSTSGSDRGQSRASTTSRSSTRSPRRQRSHRSDHGDRKPTRKREKDLKPKTTSNKKDIISKEETVTEAADVLEVDWKELGSTTIKEEKMVEEDSSILHCFTPGNTLLRMGISTDLLPPDLVEKVKNVCENEKKSAINNHLPLVLDQGLGALNRGTALSHQSWVNGFYSKTKTARLTSYADAAYRRNILGISDRDQKYPIQPPQIINARTYATSMKYYANKVKLQVQVQ